MSTLPFKQPLQLLSRRGFLGMKEMPRLDLMVDLPQAQLQGQRVADDLSGILAYLGTIGLIPRSLMEDSPWPSGERLLAAYTSGRSPATARFLLARRARRRSASCRESCVRHQDP